MMMQLSPSAFIQFLNWPSQSERCNTHHCRSELLFSFEQLAVICVYVNMRAFVRVCVCVCVHCHHHVLKAAKCNNGGGCGPRTKYNNGGGCGPLTWSQTLLPRFLPVSACARARTFERCQIVGVCGVLTGTRGRGCRVSMEWQTERLTAYGGCLWGIPAEEVSLSELSGTVMCIGLCARTSTKACGGRCPFPAFSLSPLSAAEITELHFPSTRFQITSHQSARQ